ncbi:MAG: hypothetical protein U9Q83_01270 [Bacteroidota bacterium]|nr:hypothetical protein [Bacteroidota bacterium]
MAEEKEIHQNHSGNGDSVGRDKIENIKQINSINASGDNNFIINGSP